MLVVVAVSSLSPVQFFCTPMGCCPPGSSVQRISQARILEWVVISFSRALPDPGIQPVSPALAGGLFTSGAPGKPYIVLTVSRHFTVRTLTHLSLITTLTDRYYSCFPYWGTKTQRGVKYLPRGHKPSVVNQDLNLSNLPSRFCSLTPHSCWVTSVVSNSVCT